ncbi:MULTISPECIES: response regulator transcription factor [Mucilaginibacter]|jgi:two-component system response regulator MtrA|uniref:Response regulator transcription factor n=2 Tax=Mucilaginibacter TaxID=423349 RepID=A0AAE6JKV7_9SPHI|nr:MULTISPECIES: response regulator transcription factor [Mucilaginibacter]NVM63899.1 two-component system response regulator MtrA [Mucilaginibacter sp. SG538B]QEM07619.1 response regulator transcription factor [Mucilaginibacter rubeus]QEM20073.1 response regulator transcription factor [Mucilaginibacter gossypii]QTE34906.1 response regulator transcription factor [Mucilaginibacter gossypii]QTE43216.1 response regulator transcription factor [Mucilaginibacter rubeus]
MNKEIKIALVEDDENLRFLVSERLQSEGYKVLEAGNGNEAETMILAEQPDIVLLDWMLPGKPGSEVCGNIREKGFDKLIIMMTAKAQDVDKIEAYNFGVSDYITKPYNMDVLVALIENKIKFSLNSEKPESYRFANMEHLPNTHLLIRDGRKIELTILENRILLYFLKNKNKVINREELMMEVWGYNADVNTRTLDMHIVRLRKKIETNADSPQYLQTVRGIGYKFVYNQ